MRNAVCNVWSVRIEDRFNSIAHDPVQRMIRVHARSLAKAARTRVCRDVAPAACESDAMQCRIIINALRREIDRLMRGIDRFDSGSCHGGCRPDSCDGLRFAGTSDQRSEFSSLASARLAPRLYAVAAVGDVAGRAQACSPAGATQGGQLASNSVSDVGAVIDLLA